MTIHTRTIAAVAAACGVLTGLVSGRPPERRRLKVNNPAHRPRRRKVAAEKAAGREGRAGGFTQFTRPPAPPDMIVRGKALYETNCASCHEADLRGTADGKYPNLLRSGVALRDQKGELIGARVAKHAQPITLIEADTVAVAEYIHSVHATMGGQ